MRILAVDDEKLLPEALADAIGKAEPAAEIFCFRSGKAALTFAAQTPCEVAFLDIHMRDMDGFLLAKELKRIDPTVNIIFATSCSEYALVALELHCSGYLMKPITPEKVRRELGNLRYPIRQKGQQRVYFQAFGNRGFCGRHSGEIQVRKDPGTAGLPGRSRHLMHQRRDYGSPVGQDHQRLLSANAAEGFDGHLPKGRLRGRYNAEAGQPCHRAGAGVMRLLRLGTGRTPSMQRLSRRIYDPV